VFQQLKLDENGNVGCFIRYNGFDKAVYMSQAVILKQGLITVETVEPSNPQANSVNKELNSMQVQWCWHNIQPKTILFDLLTWQAIKVK